MGSGYMLTCSNCGYEEELMEGRGFLLHEYDLKDFLRERPLPLHHFTLRKMEQLAGRHDGLRVDMEYKVLKCPFCQIPYSRLYVKVFDGHRMYHETHLQCNSCKRKLEKAELSPLEILRCPRCNHLTLKSGMGMDILWD